MLQISMVTRVAQSVIMPVAVPMGYMSSLTAPMLFKNTKKTEREAERQRLLHAKSFFWGLGDCPDAAPSLSDCQWPYRGWTHWNDSDINAVSDHVDSIQAETFLIQLRGWVEPEERRRDKHGHPSRWGRVETPGSTLGRTWKKGLQRPNETQNASSTQWKLDWKFIVISERALIEKTKLWPSRVEVHKQNLGGKKMD